MLLVQRVDGEDGACDAVLPLANLLPEQLWDAARQARVRITHGERDSIIARARKEERLERAA